MTNTETTQSAAPRPSMSVAGKATIDVALRLGGLFAAIVVVALIFIAINPNVANLNMGGSVLRSMSSVAIMALGLTLVIVVGEIDLSFGAIYGLAINSLAVLWIVHGIPVYIAIPSPSSSARWSASLTACW
jgi:ribose/xylose/arabinose/galactoside ABC-type transport system permease subunit